MGIVFCTQKQLWKILYIFSFYLYSIFFIQIIMLFLNCYDINNFMNASLPYALSYFFPNILNEDDKNTIITF